MTTKTEAVGAVSPIKAIVIVASIVGGLAFGGLSTFLIEVNFGGTFVIAVIAIFPLALCLAHLALRLRRAQRTSSASAAMFGAASIAASLLVTIGLLLHYFVFSFDTEYAPGYSEEAFRSAKIGDTREEVIEVLGEPLRTYGLPSRPVLSYSRSPSGSNYLRRDLLLDEDGRVMEIWSEVWWD